MRPSQSNEATLQTFKLKCDLCGRLHINSIIRISIEARVVFAMRSIVYCRPFIVSIIVSEIIGGSATTSTTYREDI